MEGLGNIHVGRRAPSLLFLALDFPHLLSAQSARIQRGTLWGRKACWLAPLVPAILSRSSVSPSGGLPASTTCQPPPLVQVLPGDWADPCMHPTFTWPQPVPSDG